MVVEVVAVPVPEVPVSDPLRPLHEPALAILVVDSRRRYAKERIARGPDESIDRYADRVRAELVKLLTRVNG